MSPFQIKTIVVEGVVCSPKMISDQYNYSQEYTLQYKDVAAVFTNKLQTGRFSGELQLQPRSIPVSNVIHHTDSVFFKLRILYSTRLRPIIRSNFSELETVCLFISNS